MGNRPKHQFKIQKSLVLLEFESSPNLVPPSSLKNMVDYTKIQMNFARLNISRAHQDTAVSQCSDELRMKTYESSL